MSVTIIGLESGLLRVTGDVTTLLIAPYVRQGQPFVLGFSDGSLVEGLRDRASGAWLFQTLVEGAGIILLGEEKIRLDWRIEWATIAPSAGVIVASEDRGMALETAPVDADFHVGSVADWLRRRHGPALAGHDFLPLG